MADVEPSDPGTAATGTLGRPMSERRLARLPRRLFRKIVVERSPGGWRARIVGFDGRFYLQSKSREYPTREQAIQAAKRGSRACGLPVIVIETLAAGSGLGEAA